MIRLRDLDDSALLDMLSDYTTKYTRMLHDNDRSTQFYESRRMLEKITEELTNRRSAGNKMREPGDRDRPY